ncbi:unnamed protein product [Scytosiphon promiscuus]
MAGKKNKGKKRAPRDGSTSKPEPTASAPRLSADAAEWHPPTFVTAAVETKAIPEEPEPELKPATDFDTPSAETTKGDEQQPSPEPATPPSTPRGDEDAGDVPVPLHAPAGFMPREPEAVADAPTTVVVKSAKEASVSTGIESNTRISEEAEAEEEEPPVDGSEAAEKDGASVAASAAAGGTSADEEFSLSQAAGVPEATLENAQDDTVVDPTDTPAVTDGTTAAGGADAGDQGTPTPSFEKPASADATDIARRENEFTDATSNPTDDSSGSDPEDSPSGHGRDKGSDNFFADGGGGGGILDDPMWRWGSIAAMAAVVLALGLRRR